MSYQPSISTENFIKTIYNLNQSTNLNTKPSSVARELGISSAATTDMAKKLAQKNIINHEKYKELKLTKLGNQMALNVIRKHRLWETFLYKTLGLSLHEIHCEAELLEHFTSDFLADKIDVFLGSPMTDPHGDPIPNQKGVIFLDKDSKTLALAESDCIYKISRLLGSDREFFDFCQINLLKIGMKVEVLKQYPNNKMTEIKTGNTKLILNENIANIIQVKKV